MHSNKIKELKKEILRISYLGQDGNLQSVFSSLDILWILYSKILNCNNCNYNDEDRDIFILSKGQSSLGLFVVLADLGFFDSKELETFCQFNSKFGMQGDRNKIPGVEISAGSLGHGLPIAVGMAIAHKIRGINSRIYVLTGDGEFNEGTMWESLLLAAHNQLDNLRIIIDDNKSISKMLDIGSLAKKLEAFGMEVINTDGHNHKALEYALSVEPHNKPLAIIADTFRGYGCNTLMDDPSWFHRSPTADELDNLIREVELYETTND